MHLLTALACVLLLGACGSKASHTEQQEVRQKADSSTDHNAAEQQSRSITNKKGKTIKARFNPPDGYERKPFEPGSFKHYLRKLPLKPHGAKVKFYNGEIKPNNGVYAGVIDLPIGNRDLHQCADAVIRLRAEYWYGQNKYGEIDFEFTNGFKARYSKWTQGYRVSVNGNEVNWRKEARQGNNEEIFRDYLQTLYIYAGTISLERELKAKAWDSLETGDVLVQGGSPGHAVIVVDVAVHRETGENVFMLAQSYMPAQELQVIHNPNNDDFSPWHRQNFDGKLKTPEWTFEKSDLAGF